MGDNHCAISFKNSEAITAIYQYLTKTGHGCMFYNLCIVVHALDNNF